MSNVDAARTAFKALKYDQDGKVSDGEFFSDTAKIAEVQT